MSERTTFESKFIDVPDVFAEWVKDEIDLSESTILDFGCGFGLMALGIALRLKPRKVVGVDLRPEYEELLGIASAEAGIGELPRNLELFTIREGEDLSARFRFDCIFSWSTFEHVSQPTLGDTVASLRDTLRPGGLFFLQISPLYYSAFGSHLDVLVPEPWAHLSMQDNLLQSRVLYAPRVGGSKRINEGEQAPADDQAFRQGLWSCYSTLNKLTADALVDLFTSSGFEIVRDYRTECEAEPPRELESVFRREVLKTEQIVLLLRRPGNPASGAASAHRR